jgi:ADP-ribose pyrophosphatase
MARPKTRPSRTVARTLSSKISYRGPVFHITTDEVLEPGGVRARRDVIHHSGSVVVMPVDDTEREPLVLLERQYRHAANGYLWELPAGRIDPGEKELAAAKRELIEETGYRASRWKRILNFYASPGFLGETMSIYMASGLTAGEAEPEEDERIVTKFFPLSTLVDKILRGQIRDGKTIAGVLWLRTSRTSIQRRKSA